MSTVLSVRESKWTKDSGEEVTTYYVSLRDDTGEREVPCYDAKAAELKEGQRLPEGWEVKTSKAGKPYLATPRPARGGGGGGMAAWRNTEEGARFEAERSDRRVALMQAVVLMAAAPSEWPITVTADGMYEWLRSTVSRAQAATGGPAASPPPGRGTSSAASPALGSRAAADAPSADQVSAATSGAVGALGQAVSAPSGTTRVFPKKRSDCPHRAQLVSYEGEMVCGGCGIPDALLGAKS